MRNLYASASLRNGFFTCTSFPRRRDPYSDDVDGEVDDDPHYVDEVPVDPGQLDAVVVLGRVVPAERPDGREQEQGQADEDMCAVQSGQAEEDRREGVVPRRKADPRVLGYLRREEGEAHQEREHETGAQAGTV